MNNMFKNILIYILLIIVISQARVLIIVESSYYNDPEGNWRISRYAHAVDSIDGKNVKIIEFTHPGSGTTREQCKPVWDTIMAEYVVNPSDTVEGAVFIGNIPEPMFITPDIKIKNPVDTSICKKDSIKIHGGINFPNDYYYMDLKNNATGSLWGSDLDIWTYPIVFNPDSILYTMLNDSCDEVDYDTLYFFDAGTWGPFKYKGDNIAEIWVSRIYAKPLLHYPRDTGFAVWDTGGFFEENEIISNYLDRVHDWMTGQSEVPERTMAMGHIQGYYDNISALNRLKYSIGFDTLDVEQRSYFIYPDNNGPNWQSQLQAGPYGNVNAGAFMGIRNNTVNETDNTYPDKFAPWDTRGFTWAGIIEHGHREGHTFNRTSCLSRGGNFDAVNNIPLWTKVETGGFNGGSYYISHNRDKYDVNYRHDFIAYWYHDIDTADTGWYSFQIWYAPDAANDSSGYLNIVVDDKYITGGWLNQQNNYGSSSDNWQVRFDSMQISLSNFHRNMEHRIYVFLTSHYRSSDTLNDLAIADAIRFVNLSSNDTLLVDNESPGFYCSNWNNRHFYLMPDDGGPSKAKFFVHNVCELNLFTYERVGLLYAMGHNGLISFGTVMTNYGGMDNKPLLLTVQNGGTFGEGLITMANKNKLYGNPRFSLLGAGTLKSNPGKPYIDTMYLNISNNDITKEEIYWVGDSAKIEENVTVQSGGSLSIIAGDGIHILPEFHAKYGSDLHFKIDSKLKDP